MGFRVGFTYDAKSDYNLDQADTSDKFAEFDADDTLQDISDAIESGGHEVVRIGHARNLIDRLSKGERYDIVFNIAEGIRGRSREAQVPAILEVFEQPYVGSDPVTMGITLDKALAKKIVSSEGIKTPGFFLAEQNSSLDGFNLKFPVIVKAVCEGTSKSISEKSVAYDAKALSENINHIHGCYKQNALIEEFIPGQELTVVVLGNKNCFAYPSVHIAIKGNTDLGNDIYTFERVFNDDIEYICPSRIPENLDKELRNIAERAHRALGCLDFSRMDFRVDQNGKPFFLECNPLPNLGKGDVFPLVAEAVGKNYNWIILDILQNAVERLNVKAQSSNICRAESAGR